MPLSRAHRARLRSWPHRSTLVPTKPRPTAPPMSNGSRHPPTEHCPHVHQPPLSSSHVGNHQSQVHLLLLAAFPHSATSIPTPLCTEGQWQVTAPPAAVLVHHRCPREWPHPRVKLCHSDLPLQHHNRIRCGPHRQASPPVVLLSGCHLLEDYTITVVPPAQVTPPWIAPYSEPLPPQTPPTSSPSHHSPLASFPTGPRRRDAGNVQATAFEHPRPELPCLLCFSPWAANPGQAGPSSWAK
jgi:hypothetical protein